ncbi:hypothetical protein MMC13_004140 [Lambiella insularis]|nr:hypothetical protein [Lambiella insularis]
MEPMSAPPSFTARRSAASNLPNFELPPPPLGKFGPISTVHAPQMSQGNGNVNFANLLTPPGQVPGDSMSPPISSGQNSGNNTAASHGQPPYTPTGFWPSLSSGLTPFTYGTGNTPQPWPQGPFVGNPLFPPRGLFSPSLNSMVRNSTNSPATSEGLPPPPPYELSPLPPFPTSSSSMSGPGAIPALVHQQQQQQQQQQPHQPPPHQQQMSYINTQPQGSAITTQPSPVNPSEAYMQRPPPTPTYYSGSNPSSTPHQSQFPAFTIPSPVHQQSPINAGPRISPTSSQPPTMQLPPTQQMQYPRPYQFPLPVMQGMPGPVMSNLHSPGSNMQLMNGMGGMVPFNSGHAAHMQMYGNPQQPQQNDRPFKCDQCPQSFNRNHDLKRHKRIHLAVKPFPCGHCEKSFSRKDALKRHILVKGCGKAIAAGLGRKDESDSPVAKCEQIDSSEEDDCQTMNGHS